MKKKVFKKRRKQAIKDICNNTFVIGKFRDIFGMYDYDQEEVSRVMKTMIKEFIDKGYDDPETLDLLQGARARGNEEFVRAIVSDDDDYYDEDEEDQPKYYVKKRYGAYTLLEIELVTGRTHQIRAHMAAIHHPVVGDNKYGDFEDDRKWKKLTGLDSQFLHAADLYFGELKGVLKPLSGKHIHSDLP